MLLYLLPLGLVAADLALGVVAVAFLALDPLAVDLAVDLWALAVFAGSFPVAVFLGVVFVGVDARAGDFLGSVPFEPAFRLSWAGSILAVPAPGVNRLSCPSLHRIRYRTRRSPSITSMISPSREVPPTRRALTTMRSPLLATRSPPMSATDSSPRRSLSVLGKRVRGRAEDTASRGLLPWVGSRKTSASGPCRRPPSVDGRAYLAGGSLASPTDVSNVLPGSGSD